MLRSRVNICQSRSWSPLSEGALQLGQEVPFNGFSARNVFVIATLGAFPRDEDALAVGSLGGEGT